MGVRGLPRSRGTQAGGTAALPPSRSSGPREWLRPALLPTNASKPPDQQASSVLLRVPPPADSSNGRPPFCAGPAPAARRAAGRRARSGRRAPRRPGWPELGRRPRDWGGRRAGGRGGWDVLAVGAAGPASGLRPQGRRSEPEGIPGGRARHRRLPGGGSGPEGPGLVGGAAGAGRAARRVWLCPAARPGRTGPLGHAPAQRLRVWSPCVDPKKRLVVF